MTNQKTEITEKKTHKITLKQDDKEITITSTSQTPFYLNNGDFATTWTKSLTEIATNKNLHNVDTTVLIYFIGKLDKQNRGFNRALYRPSEDIKILKIRRPTFFESINRLEKEGYIKRDKKELELLFINTQVAYNGSIADFADNDLLCQEYFAGKIDLKQLITAEKDIKVRVQVKKRVESQFLAQFEANLQNFDSDLLEQIAEKTQNLAKKKKNDAIKHLPNMFDS